MGNGSTNKPPLLILVAAPGNNLEMPSFFMESDNPIFTMLKDPKYLRYSGWNLLTLDYPHIKDGQAWEVNNGDRKTIRIYNNGSLVAISRADSTFLGWGRSEEDFLQTPLLNSLAITEYIYEFVAFYKEIIKTTLRPTRVKFVVSLENTLLASGNRLRIIPERVKPDFYPFMGEQKEVNNDFSFEKEIFLSDDVYHTGNVSYELVSKFYNRFSVPSDKIPYITKSEDGAYFVDPETWIKPEELSR